MPIIKEAKDLIKRWEGLRLDAYQDSAGVWTIGYGHTSAAGSPKVTPGMKITEAQAENIFTADLERIYVPAVLRNVKVPLNPYQLGALVSFVYNLGETAFKSSTLLRKLNEGNYDAVPSELQKWVKATNAKTGKKETLKGLVNRRAAEAGLWARESFVASRDVTPVEPSKGTTKDVVGTIGAMGGLGGLAAITEGPVAYAVAGLLVVVAVLGSIYIYKKYVKDV